MPIVPPWSDSRGLADAFIRPPGVVYLDGHSLGLATQAGVAAVQQALTDWQQLGVDGWNGGQPPWFTWPEQLAGQVARLVGAEPSEVAVTGSLTTNLHQLLATLYRPTGARRRLLIDALAFPSDRYAVQGFLHLMGGDPETDLAFVPGTIESGLTESALATALSDPSIALAVLPGVVYTSGQRLDLAHWSRFARDHGVIVIWDLAHAIGAVPVDLRAAEADAAVWCHYKHLHGGPGCPGGLFLSSRWDHLPPGLPGWWGARPGQRFSQAPALPEADGAARLQVGTPPILSLAGLAGALAVLETIPLPVVRARAWRLLGRLRAAVDDLGPPWSKITPDSEAEAGGHLAIAHPRAPLVLAHLRARGVLGDGRGPHLLRLAPSGWATTDAEIDQTIDALRAVAREPLRPDEAVPAVLVP